MFVLVVVVVIVMIPVMIVTVMPAVVRQARMPRGVVLRALGVLVRMAVARTAPMVPVMLVIPVSVAETDGDVAQIERDGDVVGAGGICAGQRRAGQRQSYGDVFQSIYHVISPCCVFMLPHAVTGMLLCVLAKRTGRVPGSRHDRRLFAQA